MKLYVGDTEVPIEDAKLNVLVKGGDLVQEPSKALNAFALGPKATQYHARRCTIEGWDERTRGFVEYCLEQPIYMLEHIDPSEAPKGRLASGTTHLIGLVDLSLKLVDQSLSIYWHHPESHLHPKVECHLSDVAIYLQKYIMYRHYGLRGPGYPPKPLTLLDHKD